MNYVSLFYRQRNPDCSIHDTLCTSFKVHTRIHNLFNVSSPSQKPSSPPLFASASKFVASVITFFTFCHSSWITLRSSNHCITWSASVMSSGGGISAAAARTKPVFSPDKVATSLYRLQNNSYCRSCQRLGANSCTRCLVPPSAISYDKGEFYAHRNVLS